MKLHTKICGPEKEVSRNLLKTASVVLDQQDPKLIAKFLNESFTEDVDESQVEDLTTWLPVISRLIEILSGFSVVHEVQPIDNGVNDTKFVVCAILRFLTFLMKTAKDKRYFLSFNVISILTRSVDLDIAQLALNLIFNVCMPTSSISSNLNDEWVDSIEVPDEVARDAFLVFDALGLLCPDLSLVAYLHGHEPTCVDMSTNTLSVRFPPRSAGQAALDVTLSVNGPDVETELQQLATQHALNEDEVWTALNIQRALAGFQKDVNYRSQITQMRLQCLFIIVHSRHIPATIHEHFKHSAPFVKELVELSDLSSEANSALNLAQPFALANVALENVLALLESRLRRRSGPIIQSNILSVLGLVRGTAAALNASGSNEEAWSSVVVAACSVSSQLFGTSFEKSAVSVGKVQSVSGESADSAVSSEQQTTSLSTSAINSIGKFVRIGLELYALSLTTRDPSAVVQDMALISTVIGVLQAANPHVKSVLTRLKEQRGSSGQEPTLCAHDVQTMLVVAKALYCLELTVEHNGYTTAFRESEGIAAVAAIIKNFSGVDDAADGTPGSGDLVLFSLLRNNVSARCAIESALSLLYSSIQKSRQTAMMQGTADTGIREVNQTYFNSFCASVFRSPFFRNEVCWELSLFILRETIDLDPPFLSSFLVTPAADALVAAVTAHQARNSSSQSSGNSSAEHYSHVDLESLLLSLARFASSVVITAEGKQFLVRSKIVQYVLETLVGPNVVLPVNNGLVGDKLVKIGKALSQVVSDCEPLRTPTKALLKERLLSLSQEASRVWAAMPLAQTPSLDTPRLLVIQKLSNLCTVVEHMFAETRRQYTELMKEVIPEPVLDALVNAFQCTLPPSRQLFAQISIRNNSTFPYFGHVPSAKAITSLLRVAASTAPSTFLQILYRNIDAQLEKISAGKQALARMAVNETISSSGADTAKESSTMMDVVAEEVEPSTPAKRLKTGAVNVHIVGVLDHFPQLSIVDPQLMDVMNAPDNGDDCFEAHSWRYLCATLTVGWLSAMLANTLRSVPKMTSTIAVTQGKDVLRRLFAYHRSSILEVSRFGSSSWQATSILDSRSKKTLLESFSECSSASDTQPLIRVPGEYRLRITGSGGALIREGVEIEGSRVVLVAEIGTEVSAYERRANASGVVRYRTSHGWISEFRRDSSRSPIIEVLSIEGVPAAGDHGENSISSESNDLSGLLTLREAASQVMTRACPAMKQAAAYLARALNGNEASGQRHGIVPWDQTFVTQLSVSLSKIVGGFFTHPRDCVAGMTMKQSWKNVLLGTSSFPIDVSPTVAVDEGKTNLKVHQRKAANSTSSSGISSSNSSGKVLSAAAEGDVLGDAGLLDAKTLCLYYGSLVKQVLSPFTEDKNGAYYVMLLRTLCNQGVLEAFLDAVVFVATVLRDEVDDLQGVAAVTSDKSTDGDDVPPIISATGRCALNALPKMLSFLRQLVNRDVFSKSLSAAAAVNSALTTSPPIDEVGPYQTHDLLFNILNTVCSRVIPLFQSQALVRLPSDVQVEWLSLVGEIVHNLTTPLPPPKESGAAATPATRSGLDGSSRSVFDPNGHIRALMPAVAAFAGSPFSTPSPIPPAVAETDSADASVVEELVRRGHDPQLITATLQQLSRDARLSSQSGSSPSPAVSTATINATSTISGVATPTVAATADETETTAMDVEEEEDEDLLNAIQMSLMGDIAAAEALASSSAATTISEPVVVALESPSVLPATPAAALLNVGGLPNLVSDLEALNDISAILGNNDQSATPPLSSLSNSALQQALQQHQQLFSSTANASNGVSTPFSPMNLSGGLPSFDFGSLFGSIGLPAPAATSLTPALVPPQAPSQRVESKSSRILKEEKKSIFAQQCAEHTSQSARLKVLCDQICSSVVANVMSLCALYSELLRWEGKHDSNLIPQLCQFIVRLNQDVVGSQELSYTQIIAEMSAHIHAQAALLQAGHTGNFFGHVFFVTTFVHDLKVRKESSSLLTRPAMVALVSSICNAIVATVPSVKVWPKWFAPSLILFHELLALQQSAEDSNKSSRLLGGTADEELLVSDDEASASGREEEKEERMELAETKEQDVPLNNSKPAVDDSQASLFPSSKSIFDSAHLLPDSTWAELFDVAWKLVDSTQATGSLPESDGYHALMMVLETLLHRQAYCAKFVESGGVRALLKLRSSGPVSDADRTNHSRVWTLVCKRCLETSVELQMEFGAAIRKTFKDQKPDKVLPGSIPLERFVQIFSTSILRSPEDFYRAALNNAKLVKTVVPGTESTFELRFLLQPEDQLHLAIKAGDVAVNKSEERAVRALKTMIKSVVSGTRAKFSDSDQFRRIVYSPSIVLDALSDALLTLKRVPHLMSRLVKTEHEALGLKATDNFVEFVVKKHFAKSISEDSLITTPKNVDLWSCTRFLAAMCAFRGASKFITVNAVLKLLSSCAHSAPMKPSSGSSSAEEVETKVAEGNRVTILARLAKLLSILVHASKSPLKNVPVPGKAAQEGVSIETVQFLVTHGNILELLTHTLSSIPLHTTGSNRAILAILELIELISRPKLQALLDKVGVKSPAANKSEEEVSASTEELVNVNGEEVAGASVTEVRLEVTVQQQHEAEDTDSSDEEEEEGEDEDNDEEEEDEEEEEPEEGEEDGGNEDHEEEEEDSYHDDEEDEEDDDDGDEDGDGDGAELIPGAAGRYAASRLNDAFDLGGEDELDIEDSYVNVGRFAAVDGRRVSGGFAALDGDRDDVLGNLNMSDARVITVPAARFGNLFGPDGQLDHMDAMIDALHRSGRAAINVNDASHNLLGQLFPGLADSLLNTMPHPSSASAGASHELLLPNGIEAALNVEQPSLSHPMLARSIAGNAATVPARPSLLGSGMPSRYVIGSLPGLPSSLLGGSRAMLFSSGGGHRSGLSSGDMGFLDSPNDMSEFDPMLSANWQQRPPDRRRDAAAPVNSALAAISILGNMQRQLISHMDNIETSVAPTAAVPAVAAAVSASASNFEVGVERNDEVSQHTEDPSALSGAASAESSQQAFYGSTLPQSLASGDDLTTTPDLSPIPSNINVTTSSDQSNEEMSVITLPNQEEANQCALDGQASLEVDPFVADLAVQDAQEEDSAHDLSSSTLSSGAVFLASSEEDVPALESAEQPVETDVLHAMDVEASPEPLMDTSVGSEMAVEAAEISSVAQEQASQSQSDASSSANANSAAAGNSVESEGAQQQGLRCPPGYDEDVFYSLPEDMQQEIVDQSAEQAGDNTEQEMRQLAELAGFDYETLQSLPEAIRNEVLEQARRDQRAANNAAGVSSSEGGGSTELDNASFLASLTPELRQDVLLTAEPEFLASLPPEMIAEATMARERAASNWQRRELVSNQAAGLQRAGRQMQPAAAAPGDDDDGDSDEDDEGDDYDDGQGGLFPPRRHLATGPSATPKPKNGLMKCPLSSASSVELPDKLLMTLARLVLHSVKDSQAHTEATMVALQHKIIQNFSVSSAVRKDVSLRLLVSLVAEDEDLVRAVLKEVSKDDGSLDALTRSSSPNGDFLSSGNSSKATLALSKKSASSDGIELSATVAHRVVTMLTKLAGSNAQFLYLLLKSRTAKFAVPTSEMAVLTSATSPIQPSADSATPVSSSSCDQQKSLAVSGRVAGGDSTNSLFELVVAMLSKPIILASAAELDSLASLVEVITVPLEQLPDNADTSVEESLPESNGSIAGTGAVTEEMRAKDTKQNVVSLSIPRVVLKRESLSSLCDVLMNDLCTKRVFASITSTVSRLAKIPQNNAVLLELVYEVIVDMAEQSQAKMDSLVVYLEEIKAKFVEASRAVEGGELVHSSSSSAATVKLPCSLLPLGESGGKQHDRLLRVVQTLLSMVKKTNRVLLDVAPVEQLSSLWISLESLLSQFRAYLSESEEDQSSTETTPAQTTLTSILNRLLPVTESFFLFHTSDLLADKPVAALEKKTTETVAADVNPVAVAPPVVPSSGSSAELIAPASMPGHKYRTTAQYLRNNLSLFAESSDESRSLRKQLSFTSTSSMTKVGSSTMPSKNLRLLSFVQAHKGVLNLIVKARPQLLDSSLSALVRVTQLRSFLKFDNKRKHFFAQLKKANLNVGRRGVHLQVRRNQVFEDTFHQLRMRSAEEMRGRLQVNFYGEEGVDAGGLTREWYVILSREIFNPNYALFLAAADGATFQPNPLSMINMNHLDYFKFVGRVIGKAICDGQLMDAHFTRSFYKHLLGMPVDFTDIEATEPDYYKVLKQILETPLDLLMMDLTFSAELHKFGRTEVEDLIPNGRNILVTDENKADYIRLVAHHRMTSAIRSQIDSFLAGFYDLVPPELICIFSPAELELLICGLPDVNIDELQANTEYHQYKASDDVIVWFWEVLRSFNREERASFLQFVTGTSKVPLGGFANLQGMRGNQRFSIHRAYGDTGLLPTAHTCFNQLDLPAYTSLEEMRTKLSMAVSEGSEGFGFA